MNNNDREEYLKAYYENEYSANTQMSYALAFTAVIIGIIMIGYISNLFVVTQSTRILTIIVMAASIIILLTSLLWSKTDRLKKPGFKYFVLLTFLGVICFLNIIIPKHAIIGWAISLVLVNHYYNPKVGKQVFVATLILMLLCIYGAMLVYINTEAEEREPDLDFSYHTYCRYDYTYTKLAKNLEKEVSGK